jgi:DNA-binding GntR family transcriptional regulator
MAKSTRTKMAYDYLYNGIVNNRILPGSPLVEQEISDILGISRTPVREALKQLEAQGLITYIPQRGTFVKELDIQDVEEIFALREELEILALKISIKTIPDEEILKLERMLKELDYSSNYEDFYRSDRSLHHLIVKYGQNRRLDAFLNSLNSQIEMLRRISSRTPKRLEMSKREHMEILTALKERNKETAIKILREHISNVKKSVIKTYQDQRVK